MTLVASFVHVSIKSLLLMKEKQRVFGTNAFFKVYSWASVAYE